MVSSTLRIPIEIYTLCKVICYVGVIESWKVIENEEEIEVCSVSPYVHLKNTNHTSIHKQLSFIRD